MWDSETPFAGGACHKEVVIFNKPNATCVDAELGRYSDCDVRHAFPAKVAEIPATSVGVLNDAKSTTVPDGSSKVRQLMSSWIIVNTYDYEVYTAKEKHTAGNAQRKAQRPNQERQTENSQFAVEKANLEQTRNTLNRLTLKIVAKTQRAHAGTGNTVQRLRAALAGLFDHCADSLPIDEQEPDADSPEVVMLTEQLSKLDKSNERLQNELAGLRAQLAAVRRQNKDKAKKAKATRV